MNPRTQVKKRLCTGSLLLLVLVALWRFVLAHNNDTSAPSTAPQEFQRRAMLENITTNVILPYHEAFRQQAGSLQAAVYAFRDTPALDSLQTLQQAWRETALAWARCEVFEFGRLTLQHHAIEKTPTDTELIEHYIAGDEKTDEAFVESIGSTAKGLPAIEYLIFNPDQGNDYVLQTFADERRMDYLIATVENLNHKAEELYNIWAPAGENYAGTFINANGEGRRVRESVSMLTNQMAYMLEQIVQMKLALPMGLTEGTGVQPDLVEARLSQHSLPQIIATIESIQQVFNGGNDLGFDDYLNYLDASYEGELLSVIINTQADKALAALRAIEKPLDIALVEDYDSVMKAFDEVRTFFLLIRTGMTGQLGVTITFSDNDGD